MPHRVTQSLIDTLQFELSKLSMERASNKHEETLFSNLRVVVKDAISCAADEDSFLADYHAGPTPQTTTDGPASTPEATQEQAKDERKEKI